MPEYSYCETPTAGSATPWHIRKLTGKGRRLGGGADTPSLCGRKVAWDLTPPVVDGTTRICSGCLALYRKETINDLPNS